MADKDATKGAAQPAQSGTKDKEQAGETESTGKTTEDMVREQGADSGDEPES